MNFFKQAFLTLFSLVAFALPAFAEDNVSSRDIVIDLDLNASAEKAWALWTQSEMLASWLATKANVNPVLGGSYELFWDPVHPDQNSTIGCKITGIEPLRFLSFQWKGPVLYADLMNVDPMPTWVLLSFESASNTKTLIHFRHSGWGTSERWKEARKWQTNAWIGAFEQLKKVTQ